LNYLWHTKLSKLSVSPYIATLFITPIFLVFILLFASANATANQQSDFNAPDTPLVHRIVGGDEVPDETKYPFMVALYSDANLDGLFQPL